MFSLTTGPRPSLWQAEGSIRAGDECDEMQLEADLKKSASGMTDKELHIPRNRSGAAEALLTWRQ